MIPRLSIDFDEQNTGFVIEELTFNPYIAKKRWGSGLEADIWVEFSIRRTGKGKSVVPKLKFCFASENNYINEPSTYIPARLSGIESCQDDMNFIMYSDIWYSFVRFDNIDYEFMEYGYNNPVRVLQIPIPKESLTESSFTGEYKVFRKGKLRTETGKLKDRIKYFNGICCPFNENRWKGVDKSLNRPQIDTMIPIDDGGLSSVKFEFKKIPLKAKFAVRRQPWNANEEDKDTQVGVGYGGTAEVNRISGLSFEVIPKLFDIKSSKKIPAELSSGELMFFWVMFSSDSCISQKKTTSRIGFNYQLVVNATVENFNSFLRSPKGYDAVQGTISDYKHYAVPPRLFFLWEDYLPEQCLALTKTLTKSSNTSIEINTAFNNIQFDNDKLISLFILGFIASIYGNVFVSSMFSNPRYSCLAVAAFIAIAILVLASIMIYVNRIINIIALLTSSFLVLSLPAYLQLKYSAIYIVILFMVAVALIVLSMHTIIPVNFRLMYPKFIKQYIYKRNYNKTISKGVKA
jgi:hypothetical protein